MTIKKRNRIRATIASRIAHAAGREAASAQGIDCLAGGCLGSNCQVRAYDDASRSTYGHLTRSRVYGGRLGIGLPALQRMVAS